VFVSPSVLQDETAAQYGVQVIGQSDELLEQFFAISVERRITHPCVVAITQAARSALFGAEPRAALNGSAGQAQTTP
jgi:LysR family transcriptional activator of nhaA